MSSFNYRSITPQVISAANKKPGHSDTVLFAPTSDFTLIALPTGPFLLPGSTKKITANHTFPPNAGWKTFQCKPKSVDPTADAAGEAGGQVPNYKFKCIIKGDDAVINEFVENLLNEDIISLFNDPVCGQTRWIQVGSACTPANIAGFAFRGGTKSAGGFPEYEFSVESSDRFYYFGDIVMAVEDPQLGAITSLSFRSITATTLTVEGTIYVDDATGYDMEKSLHANFSVLHGTRVSQASKEFAVTGLTANQQYHFRMRATAPGFIPGPWEVAVIDTPAA